MAAADILQCLSLHSHPSFPISQVTYFPNTTSYPSILNSYIRNLRFTSPITPKPSFIITPTHLSHIQASIICCNQFSLQLRIRSGGHDYDGLSYVSQLPFIILDMFMLQSVDINMDDCTAWVDSGATIVEKTLEQGATEIVHQWQHVAHRIHHGLFIRVVLSPVKRNGKKTIRAKFNALFLGDSEELLGIMNENFPELGLVGEQCIEMSWIDSVLFWYNYPVGTSREALLQRVPESEKFLKRKSDYVQKAMSKTELESLWEKMMELEKPVLTLNPYGGRMSEISEVETPFPHRAGNLYKIQYSVNWKEEGNDVANHNLDAIRRLYDYMTPYVCNSPRSSYLNYRDVDIGVNGDGNADYAEASIWGSKYFKGNFDRLVEVKTMVDPGNFFRYEQSIPSLASWDSLMSQ
ncbi:hypothetical protein Ahy_B03g062113 isoform B [Arachis hypogaea]|nr:hypothetical protein Ahy_B03g062113 isoform B [Arachis hypogaea]